MEEKVQSASQKIYEDKLKQMEFVDSTKLIPLLISVSRESHNDEILKRDKLFQRYENALQEVEEKFKEKEKELTESHKREIKEVVTKSKGDPDEIRKRIEEEFGFKFVE